MAIGRIIPKQVGAVGGGPTSSALLDHRGYAERVQSEPLEMSSEPLKISVAMVTYQGERYVTEQLRSILDQTRLPDEIVVGDDASSDSTTRIIADFQLTSSVPVRLLIADPNSGLDANIRRVIEACEGQVLVFADQDDVWAPQKIESIEQAFQDPRVSLWFSDAELIDEAGRPMPGTVWTGLNHFEQGGQARVANGKGLRLLLRGRTVTGATMAVRREIARLAVPIPADGSDGERLFLHDGWMAVLAATMGRVVVEPKPLTSYRRHVDQYTSRNRYAALGEWLGSPRTLLGRLRRRGRWIRVEAAASRLVAERLRAAGVLDEAMPSAREELLALEEWASARAATRWQRGRVRAIVGQLRKGNYDRFARGPRTALGDILELVKLSV